MSKKSESCKNLTNQQLCDAIKNGTLRHAAARFELKARGLDSMVAKADADGFRDMAAMGRYR